MQRWHRTALGSLFVPGGVLLFTATVLANTAWLTLPLPALTFLYYCAVIGGMLLAWRFHSSRVFFALLILFLAHEGVGIFIREVSPGLLGWSGLQAVAILFPADLFLIALMQERGLTVASTAPLGLFLFVQVVVLSVFSQSSVGKIAAHAHRLPVTVALPEYCLFILFTAGAILLVRSLLTRKPADHALFWSLVGFFLALRDAGTPRMTILYSIGAAIILATAIVENSYLLAYHDELTALPSRRAFNDALLRLPETYSVAVVDIDYFKRFNDTYGHDIGDQVLRLVATNLSRVSGGGRAYRCGGEEFTILFPGKTTLEVARHLEQLRETIEHSHFHMRGEDRRHIPRGPDRRNSRAPKRARKGHAIRRLAAPANPSALSVTVSMGVATANQEDATPESVIKAADEALYRAKANGRNRIETAAVPVRRSRGRAAGIA
ncbi:MAG: GGDEF domain-containing protein [Candidatus Sulfotelmatobacter sp.]